MAKFGCPVALIAFLVMGSSGCLLYTEEINHPPTVKVTGPAMLMWGEPAVYSAEPSDPDESPGALKVEWLMAVTCPVTVEAARMGTPVAGGIVDFTFDTHLAPGDDFCMFVVVSDKNQAAALAKVPTKLTHQDVQAVIDVVKPTSQPGDRYELFSTLQVSGAKSKDPETGKKVTLRWSLTHNAEPHELRPCPEGGDTERCFTAKTPGEYRLELVAASERGEVTATKVLTVEPDRPPCIGQTFPEFELHKIVRDAADEFEVRIVSVDDDGDPLPEIPGRPSNYRFVATWWRAGDTGPPVRRPAELERFDRVPFRKDYFQPGDEVFVRVQVKDRVDRDNDFAECVRTSAENCALTKRPGCFQWVTWKVRFI